MCRVAIFAAIGNSFAVQVLEPEQLKCQVLDAGREREGSVRPVSASDRGTRDDQQRGTHCQAAFEFSHSSSRTKHPGDGVHVPGDRRSAARARRCGDGAAATDDDSTASAVVGCTAVDALRKYGRHGCETYR